MFYREFIITYVGDPEFKKLLEACDHPVYGILMHNKLISTQIKDIGIYMNFLGVGEQDIVLIPTSLCRDMQVEVVMDNKKASDRERFLREGIIVRTALLFSSKKPQGFGSAEFLQDPLRLLKDRTSSVLTEKITDSIRLAKALWKLRNDVKVINYRSFSKLLVEQYNIDTIEPSGTSSINTRIMYT